MARKKNQDITDKHFPPAALLFRDNPFKRPHYKRLSVQGPEALKEGICSYLDSVYENNGMPTLPGLALHLNCSTRTLHRYLEMIEANHGGSEKDRIDSDPIYEEMQRIMQIFMDVLERDWTGLLALPKCSQGAKNFLEAKFRDRGWDSMGDAVREQAGNIGLMIEAGRQRAIEAIKVAGQIANGQVYDVPEEAVKQIEESHGA